MTFTVLINEHSGTVAKLGRDDLSEKLREAFGSDLNILEMLSPEEFSNALQNLENSSKVIIGGGDGTIRSAAAALKDRNIPFGILPLGTMNQFAKDLSLELDPVKLAAQYKNHKTLKIDAGTVNGELFLCNAMVGLPSQLAKEREELRHESTLAEWVHFLKKGLKKLSIGKRHPMSLTYEGITEHKFIKAAIIANNEYEDRGIGFHKKSLSDGTLAVYTINPEGTMESIAMLSQLAFGSLQNAPGLETFSARQLTITTPKHHANVLLDGEIMRLHTPLVFKSEPAALNILIPEVA